MRRVLLVFDPPDGGVAENVRRLALGLREHGWEPWVCGPEDSIIYDDLRAAQVPFARLPLRPGYDHLASDLRALRRLGSSIRHGGFPIVHSHNAKAGVLARLAAVGTPAVSLYSPHCFPFVAPFSPLRVATSTTIERLAGRATDMILCVADEERRQALEHGIVGPERLRVIHNGCPPPEEGLEPDAEVEEFKAGRPLAASLCVLREQKAVHVFVDAAPLVLERCPDAALAVIGNGELRGELEAQAARLGLGERLRFFDFRGPSARQLASIDVFVLPSGWEAFPISVLEAMSCGVPAVATDVGGTSEALLDGETGLLCPPGDSAVLADRVARLLGDEELRKRMGAAGRERYEREFRVELMVQRTAELYDELAAA